MNEYELKPLPYSADALEPYIDAQTMTIHHDKHHKAYLDKLLTGLEKHPDLKKKHPEELVKDLNSVPEDIRTVVRNHGGGFINHNFFWTVMAPKAGGEPSGKVGDAIASAFGSFDKFKEELTSAGLNRFGSGWAWLVINKGKLEVYSTANQDSPLIEGKIPLLALDVWEHSYYLKHQSNRAAYIQDWWNVVNWKQVEDNLKKSE
ncbi:MAG TPA: superoxide dismutase [Candidatus Nanoarchaeia archaeon]|nr:superoxide dismutase [Candidatus Nanoarchaeia archaeon]